MDLWRKTPSLGPLSCLKPATGEAVACYRCDKPSGEYLKYERRRPEVCILCVKCKQKKEPRKEGHLAVDQSYGEDFWPKRSSEWDEWDDRAEFEAFKAWQQQQQLKRPLKNK